jgi:hypothetical protein
MSSKPESRTNAPTTEGNRRRAERRELHSNLRLSLDAQSIEGLTENVSDVGALFFSEGSLRVTVEFEDEGETRRYTGRLVRAQRMSEDRVGYAIEFDEA